MRAIAMLRQARQATATSLSVFIRDPQYGTRCSTVLAIGRDGRGTIIERSFDAEGKATGEVAIPF